VTATFTTEDVIQLLQSYKVAAQKLFRSPVHLSFDRSRKEIVFEIPAVGGSISKKVALYQLAYRPLKIEEALPYLYTIKVVDEWIEKLLSPTEAEAIFWRYINHDFEFLLDERRPRSLTFKTLSYEEIQQKMNLKSRISVYRLIKRGLTKIVKQLNREGRKCGSN